MVRCPRPWMALGVLPLMSCGDDIFDEFARKPACDTLDTDGVCHDIHGSSGTTTPTSTASTSTTSTSEDSTSTSDPTGTDEVPGTSATTSASGSDGDSADDGPDLERPLTAKLTAWPSPVLQVGTVNLTLAVQGPAVSVDLYDGETLLLAGAAPVGALYDFAVTSDDHPGDGLHALRAVVHDAHGHTVEALATLEIDVPAGGALDWAHVEQDQLSAYSSVAMLAHDTAVAGYRLTGDKANLAVARLDRTTGAPISGPLVLEPIVWSGESRGPAIAVAPDGAVYVAATRRVDDSTTRVVYKLRLDEPVPTLVWGAPVLGVKGESAEAIAVVGDKIVVAGSMRTGVNAYDLRVWWLSSEDGYLLKMATFAALVTDDVENLLVERAYGVAHVGEQVVVAGTRDFILKDQPNKTRTRTVVLRYSADGKLLGEWTSPGDVMPEDAALAVTSTKDGAFAITGWASTVPGAKRSVLTRRFSPKGEHLWSRPEFSGAEDSVGYAIAEDSEGKLIIAATRLRPGTDYDAWIFAAPGDEDPRAWEIFRNGAGNGPDEAVGLALDAWSYIHVVGSELTGLEIHAFALRLFP